jgi:polar amino acid transport system substrate-binding protein
MKNITLLLGVLLGLVAASVGQAETLTVFGDQGYPPMIYSAEGHPSGILVDILKKVSAKTGDTYVLQLFPWKRAYESALAGLGGLIGASYNAERAQLFDYSAKIYDDDIQLVMLAGKEFPFRQLKDLKGKSIGGVIGASYGAAVDDAIAAGVITIERDTTQEGRLKKLLAGRIDAAFIGNGNDGLERLVASDGYLRAHRKDLFVAPKPVNVDPLHLVFAKSMKKTAVLQRFDKALAELRP